MKKYLKYKGIKVNHFGIPIFHVGRKDAKKSGEPGKRYFQYRCFIFNYKKDAIKDLIVMYDFPSDKKKEREWFRRHLQKFDYIMVQKSIWVGPSPLPKDFLNYVKKLGLSNQLRTLKLAKPYSAEDKDM